MSTPTPKKNWQIPRQCLCSCGQSFVPTLSKQRYVNRNHQAAAYRQKFTSSLWRADGLSIRQLLGL